MLRRYNTGYEDGNYSVPAGHLDGGEEVKSAAIREAYEECGIQLNEADIEVIGVMHRRSADERIDFFVRAQHWTGEIQNMEPNKCDKLEWYSTLSLPDNTIPYIKAALDSHLNNEWFTSYGWHDVVAH